jgi:hypothetical protein
MRYFLVFFSSISLLVACHQNDNKFENISEDQLGILLKSDPLFKDYVNAFIKLRRVIITNPKQTYFSSSMKEEIKDGKIRNLQEYKENYISKGGNPD